MEITEGSTAHTLAILAMDRAEALDKTTVQLQATVRKELLGLQAILPQGGRRVPSDTPRQR